LIWINARGLARDNIQKIEFDMRVARRSRADQ
jgi:hypothetical protein